MADDIQKTGQDLSDDRIKEDDRRIPLVEEIFHNIVKSIKTISIYKHNKDRFSEFIEPAYRLLERFLKQHDSLTIKVEPYSFKFLNATVYENTDKYSNISYRFFKDGVRRITFRQGLSLNEFLQFVLIVSGLSQVSKQTEDTVSQLWLANLENIELTVIEGGISFSDSDGNENTEEKVEVDTIVNFLERKLSSQSNDVVGFARISTADIGMELESVQQIKGLQKKPDIVKPEIKQAIQEFFISEDEFTKITRIKKILMVVLKSNIDDIEQQDIFENYILILDYLFLFDDLTKIAELFTEIEKESINMTLPSSIRDRIMQLRMRLQQETNADIRLDRIIQILKNKRIENQESLKTVFDQFTEFSYEKLPKLIEQIEIQENQNAILEILKTPRAGYEKLWCNLLSSKKINLVSMALDVLKEVDFEEKRDAVIPLLKSPVKQIVIKALEILASDNSDISETEIMRYLDQNKLSARDNVIKIIHLMEEETQANIILKLLLDESFKVDDSLRLTLYTKMADLIILPQVESYFDSLFNEKGSLFSKGKLEEKKRLIIKALKASPSLKIYQYLVRHSKNEYCSEAIRREIAAAAEYIRQRLQGK